MKYKYGNFFQMSNEFFTNDYLADLSTSAAIMYVYLCHLEHKYTGEKKSTFLHTDKQLCDELHMSMNTVRKCKRELQDIGLIQTSLVRPDKNNGDGRTSFEVTEYQLNL